MEIITRLPLCGTLSARLDYTNGVQKQLFVHKENVITNASKQALVPPLYTSVTSDPVNTFKIGTGGTIDPQGQYPKTVDGTLTSLFTEINSYSIVSHLFPDPYSVTFLVDVPTADGNGSLINEAGMFTESGTMFNIKTFPAIPKTSDFSIHFEWTIRYV